MKKLLLLFALVSILNVIQAQVPSNCSVPQLLKDNYHRDIRQLATKRLFQLQSPDTALVKIPQTYIDTISGGLAAILNATSIPERDSVFNIYCVHHTNDWSNSSGWNGSYAGFLVQVDTSYSWTQAWQNLNTITGNALMDTITARYNLTITTFYNWVIGNYALLSTDSSWNIHALMDSLEMTAGVLSTEPNAIFGSAGTISYSSIGNTRYYDFEFEWMDCFDGCDGGRIWTFKVNSDCSVEYLGFVDWCHFGTVGIPPCDYPVPINCNTFVSVPENNIQINHSLFPNPFSVQTTLQTDIPLKNATLTVYNCFGQRVKEIENISGQAITLQRDNLVSGVYFLHLKEDSKVIATEKLLITD